MAITAPAFGAALVPALVAYHPIMERKINPFSTDQINPSKFRRAVEYLVVRYTVALSSLNPATNSDYELFRGYFTTKATTATVDVDLGASGVSYAPKGGGSWRYDDMNVENNFDGTANILVTFIAETTWTVDA